MKNYLLMTYQVVFFWIVCSKPKFHFSHMLHRYTTVYLSYKSTYVYVCLHLYTGSLIYKGRQMSKLLMRKAIDFYGRPSRMSNKMIIIIPKEFHKDFEKMLGKLMKFHGEEFMD